MNTTDKKQKVCVLGLGYIGLPTAALLANTGFEVHGVDVVPHVVETINKGDIHIVEPDLDAFVHAAVHSGHLKASLQPGEADIFMIAVPTPFKENHEPDLKFVLEAANAIAPFLKPGNLVILESTSPVGSTQLVKEAIQNAGVEVDEIHFAYCPERVLPGQVMKELIENDRIVGGLTTEATQAVAAFYRVFVKGEVLETNANTAEMCKLTENASRDVSIAFANELSMICDQLDINVWELISLANKHPRVNILRPGPGVGGHCIAVDPWFIVSRSPEQAKIIRSAREINNFKTDWSIQKIINACLKHELETGKKPVVGVMGLAFKPDIDDLRESPAVHIYEALVNENLNLLACEPNLKSHSKITLSSITEVLTKAEILVFLVAHKPFTTLQIPEQTKVLDFVGIFPKGKK